MKEESSCKEVILGVDTHLDVHVGVNAVAESFFHTLKTRLIYRRKDNTMEELQRDLY